MECLQLLKNEQICYVCCGIMFMPCGKEKKRLIDRLTQFLFKAEKSPIIHLYRHEEKCGKILTKLLLWGRDQRGEDKLLIYPIITLLCLTYNKGYLIEILSISVLTEVLQAKIKNSNVNTSPSRQRCFRPITFGVSHFFFLSKVEHSLFLFHHFILQVRGSGAGNMYLGIIGGRPEKSSPTRQPLLLTTQRTWL